MNLKETAEFYRLALEGRLCPLQEAIAWCDSVIMQDGIPDQAIINATLAGSRGIYEVARELQEVEGTCDSKIVVRRLFRTMRDLLANNSCLSFRIGLVLLKMAYSREPELENIEWTEIWALYDELDMPEEMVAAFSTAELPMDADVRNRLLAFLERESN